MTMTGELVVIDTGLFSDALLPSRDHVVDAYERDLDGRKLVVSFQTVAEVRYGALWRGWGRKRVQAMESHLSTALEVPAHVDLTREWALLRNDCRRAGHAFHAKIHVADLWVAATATLLGLPLVTHDSGFRGVPGLDVICHV